MTEVMKKEKKRKEKREKEAETASYNSCIPEGEY